MRKVKEWSACEVFLGKQRGAFQAPRMDILEATRRFERWLRRRINVVEADLDYKHEEMRSDPFLFFRATFYRWAQLWPEICPRLARAVEVYSVGDLHLENFGTWRDTEGRLVWGVNDFDEAHPMAFPNDLVRVAVSALLASESSLRFQLKQGEIYRQLVEGYRESLEREGEPFVLMEQHPKLREMALQELRQPAAFWSRLEAKTAVLKTALPKAVRKGFEASFPRGVEPHYRVVKLPKGLGSLGRERYFALATWQGGMIAREAKAVVPSACLWAAGDAAGKGNPWLEKTVEAAVRCPDPYYGVRRGWLVRRLAPDCSRIDFDELTQHKDVASLLFCMGRETAHIHLGTPKGRRKILAEERKLTSKWLEKAAQKMLKASLHDWRQFKDASARQLAR